MIADRDGIRRWTGAASAARAEGRPALQRAETAQRGGLGQGPSGIGRPARSWRWETIERRRRAWGTATTAVGCARPRLCLPAQLRALLHAHSVITATPAAPARILPSSQPASLWSACASASALLKPAVPSLSLPHVAAPPESLNAITPPCMSRRGQPSAPPDVAVIGPVQNAFGAHAASRRNCGPERSVSRKWHRRRARQSA